MEYYFHFSFTVSGPVWHGHMLFAAKGGTISNVMGVSGIVAHFL